MHLMEGVKKHFIHEHVQYKGLFYAHPYIITLLGDKHTSVHPLRGVNLDFPNRPIVLDTSVQIVVPCSTKKYWNMPLCHSY